MKSSRIRLIENDDFTLEIEYTDTFFILHLPALKATKGAIQHLKLKVQELKEFADTVGYDGVIAGIVEGDIKMRKLLRMVDGEYKGSSEGFELYLL